MDKNASIRQEAIVLKSKSVEEFKKTYVFKTLDNEEFTIEMDTNELHIKQLLGEQGVDEVVRNFPQLFSETTDPEVMRAVFLAHIILNTFTEDSRMVFSIIGQSATTEILKHITEDQEVIDFFTTAGVLIDRQQNVEVLVGETMSQDIS